MKAKHKRLIIIGCFIVYGMLTLTLAALNFIFLKYQDGAPTTFGYICFFSIILARFMAGILHNLLSIKGNELVLMFLFQFFLYAFVGWIIARLVYPNKKLPPEPDK